MTNCILPVVFVFTASLFLSVTVQTENITVVQNEEVSSTTDLGTDKAPQIGFKNKSHIYEECDCGWGSLSCYYNTYHEKVCNCEWQYSQNGDKCERCVCGTFSSKCEYENGKKICTCFGNYKQDDFGKCSDCDCGYNFERCDFEGYKKKCTCYSGYIEADGKCKKCDCGYMSTDCKLTFDGYARCTCKPGFVAQRTTWRIDEVCKMPGPSGWKIATYIESVIFGIIILACIACICCKKGLDS